MIVTMFKTKPMYFVFANQLLERATYLIFYIVLARILATEEYGILITVFAFSNIVQIIFDFGLPFYVQREIASCDQNYSKLDVLFTIKYLSFPIIICIELAYLSIVRDINPIWVILIGTATHIQSINLIYNSIFYAKECYKEPLLNNVIAKVIFLLLFLILIYLKYSVILFLISFLIGSMLVIILQRANLISKHRILAKYTFSLAGIGEILRSSLQIGTGLIFVTIYDRADIILLQLFMNYSDVAIYAVSYSLFRSFQIFGSSVLLPAYTKYSGIFGRNGHLEIRDIKKEFYTLVALSAIFILIACVFGEWVITLLYGSSYNYSSIIFIALMFAIPGVFLNNLTGVISNSTRQEKIPLVTTGVGVLVGIGCNILLIPLIGLYGAVSATIITEYSVFIFQLILLRKGSVNNSKINEL
ncbi:MAG: hypothetical protein CVV24_04800 [Ignavibacteriae bacterium HGW-Ignavibacteriae-3]|nr:MAG: hypothetical protein CVV24_04800 [Ignavibacteriae bacterium HGW-Ignavibacteriae-3]